MAFGAGVTLGGTADKTAGTTIVHTVTAAAAVGDLVAVRVPKNNELTTDANDTNEVTSVVDSAGNTYTKLGEARRGAGTAAAGATGALFISKLTAALTSGVSTITANFSNSPAASALTAWKHTIGAGNTFQIAGVVQYETLLGGPGALVISGLPSKEYLFLRAEAMETDTPNYAPTASYTAVTEVATTGGGAASNMASCGEFRILTGTGDTSDPTGNSTDHVGIFIALEEIAEGGTTFTVNLAGSVTPTGTLTKQTNKALAGSVTPAGALSREARKALAGTLTPSGVLAHLAQKVLGGSVTPAGALSNVRTAFLSVAGSVTPTGALAGLVQKVLAGQTTPTGTLTKEARKTFAGTVTPAGALANAKVAVLALAGSITPTGVVSMLAAKVLSGSVAPAGALTKQAQKPLGGTVTSAGSLANVRTALVQLAGQITPTGALGPWLVSKALGGQTTPTGALSKLVAKAFAGSVTPTGSGLFELVSGTVRNLLLTLGRLAQKWRTGALAQKWRTGSTRAKWSTGGPEGD